MAQWTFLDWLLVWILETSYFEFDWDVGNSAKNSKNRISRSTRSSLFLDLGKHCHWEYKLRLIQAMSSDLVSLARMLKIASCRWLLLLETARFES